MNSLLRPFVASALLAICFLAFPAVAQIPDSLHGTTTVVASGDNIYSQLNVPLGLTNVVAVSASWGHRLALRADGTVVAWGTNALGQIDVPAGLSNVVAVVATIAGSLALTREGRIVAWGLGEAAVPPGLIANAIAAGVYHRLALRPDGTVVAWGGENSLGRTNVPPGLTNVIAVAAGGDHSLALKRDGTVIAWGINWAGQTDVPAGLSNVVSVHCGPSHSLALKADGSVVAWGRQTNVPANVKDIATICRATYYANYAIRRDGSLIAWAADSATSFPVTSLSNVIAFDAWNFDGVAVIAEAAPFVISKSWTQNVYRGARAVLSPQVIGTFPFEYQWRLNGTDIPGETNRVLTIEQAGSGTYAVDIRNAFGSQTVNVTLNAVDSPPYILTAPRSQTVPRNGTAGFEVTPEGSRPFSYQWRRNGSDLPGETNVTLVLRNVTMQQAGSYSVLVRNAQNSIVSPQADLLVIPLVGWGDNSYGQLDIPAAVTNAVAVSANGHHSLVLRADGRVAAWGAGSLATYAIRTLWTNFVDVAPRLTNLTALAAGRYHDLALKADGTLVGWGDNGYHQIDTSGLSNVIEIAATIDESVTLNGDGTVARVGRSIVPGVSNIVALDTRGRFAVNANGRVIDLWHYSSDFTVSPDMDSNLKGWLHDVVSVDGYAALKGDRTVVAWDSQGLPWTNAPVSDVVAILGTLALKSDGSLAVWGPASPGFIEFANTLTNVIGIAAGSSHVLALIGDGSPVITVQPAWRMAYIGAETSFAVMAAGAPPLSYQWYHGQNAIDGATNFLLTVSPVQSTDSGNYRAVIRNASGQISSKSAALTVIDGPPTIVAQPRSLDVLAGTDAIFQVVADGSSPVYYQWRFGDVDVPGATNADFVLNSVQRDRNGLYSVVVSNNHGVVTSAVAPLVVHYLPPANDAFENRIELFGTNVVAITTNIAATAEDLEPDHTPTNYGDSGNKSVWWSWTAPAFGVVRIDTAGSDFDTVLAVYVGSSVTDLVRVADNDDCADGLVSSCVTFPAQEGATYAIAVASFSNGFGAYQDGLVQLNISYTFLGGARLQHGNLTGFFRSIQVSGASFLQNGVWGSLQLGGPVQFNGSAPLSFKAFGQAYRAGTGNVTLQFPKRDADVNSFPDLVQINQSVDIPFTGSGYFSFAPACAGLACVLNPPPHIFRASGPLTVSGRFSREAGSILGRYSMTVTKFGETIRLSGYWFIKGLSGTLVYARGPTNYLALDMSLHTVTNDTVLGTSPIAVPFQILNKDTVVISPFRAPSPFGYSISAITLTRFGNRYRGQGGILGTLEFRDLDDSNCNGIPDFSDSSTKDRTAPSVTITAPAAGARVTNTLLTVRGTAADDCSGLAAVQYRINADEYQNAAGRSTWSGEVLLQPGANTFWVNSIDRYGNQSTPVSRTFTYVVETPLTLTISGSGTVISSLNGKLLEIGESYSVFAAAAAGNLFSHWSGDVSGTGTNLTFTMRSNLVVQANFVTNLFLAVKGTYDGLFYEPAGVLHESSGALRVALGGGGGFTSTIISSGKSNQFSGRFDLSGKTTNSILLGTDPLSLELALDLQSGTDQLAGTIRSSQWTANLDAPRAIFDATNNPATNFAGRYTLLIQPEGDGSASPGGYSYGMIRVDLGGTAILTGRLADGQPINVASSLSKDGEWPIYAPLYSGKGSVLSWIIFTNTDSSSCNGVLSWIRPAISGARYYPAGFSNQLQTVGSRYLWKSGTPVVNFTNAVILFDGGQLPAPITHLFSVPANISSTIVRSGNNLEGSHFTFSLNPTNGFFNGSFTVPGTTRTNLYEGVVLQLSQIGAGHFRGDTQTGSVWLAPVP